MDHIRKKVPAPIPLPVPGKQRMVFFFRVALEFPVQARRWDIAIEIPEETKYSVSCKEEFEKALKNGFDIMLNKAGLLDYLTKKIIGAEALEPKIITNPKEDAGNNKQ